MAAMQRALYLFLILSLAGAPAAPAQPMGMRGPGTSHAGCAGMGHDGRHNDMKHDMGPGMNMSGHAAGTTHAPDRFNPHGPRCHCGCGCSLAHACMGGGLGFPLNDFDFVLPRTQAAMAAAVPGLSSGYRPRLLRPPIVSVR